MTSSYYLNCPDTPPRKKISKSMMVNLTEVKLGICHGCKLKFDNYLEIKYCDIYLHAVLVYIQEIERDSCSICKLIPESNCTLCMLNKNFDLGNDIAWSSIIETLRNVEFNTSMQCHSK